jgi:hypothetical protein
VTRAPRVFGIPALRAPVVAVLRRGPSDWAHVGRWDVERGVYEPGAWLHGALYPQRCDLSPDGRWLCYFALKGSARWEAGGTYIAISRLPWLTALAAWGTCGTWTRGLHFVEDRRVWDVSPPDEGDVAPCRQTLGLAVTRAATFAVERRRGWSEAPGTPPREADDAWDEQRADRVRMEKPRPGSAGAVRLAVQGRFAAFRSSMPGETKAVRYDVLDGGGVRPLEDVQWADWDAAGRLLVATLDGRLQVRDIDAAGAAVRWELDLSGLTPDPTPPPDVARRW